LSWWPFTHDSSIVTFGNCSHTLVISAHTSLRRIWHSYSPFVPCKLALPIALVSSWISLVYHVKVVQHIWVAPYLHRC
jgi:hypothetical protein